MKEHIIRIGGFSSRQRAERDLADFASPEVFARRSAFFANPNNYGITVKVVNSEVYRWDPVPSPSNQCYIELTLELEADNEANIDSWIKVTENALRVYMPDAYYQHAKSVDVTPEREIAKGAAQPGTWPIGVPNPANKPRELVQPAVDKVEPKPEEVSMIDQEEQPPSLLVSPVEGSDVAETIEDTQVILIDALSKLKQDHNLSNTDLLDHFEKLHASGEISDAAMPELIAALTSLAGDIDEELEYKPPEDTLSDEVTAEVTLEPNGTGYTATTKDSPDAGWPENAPVLDPDYGNRDMELPIPTTQEEPEILNDGIDVDISTSPDIAMPMCDPMETEDDSRIDAIVKVINDNCGNNAYVLLDNDIVKYKFTIANAYFDIAITRVAAELPTQEITDEAVNVDPASDVPATADIAFANLEGLKDAPVRYVPDAEVTAVNTADEFLAVMKKTSPEAPAEIEPEGSYVDPYYDAVDADMVKALCAAVDANKKTHYIPAVEGT